MSDIIEKIGKMLVLAERASTEEEADAFFKKAQALASNYSVNLEIARQSVVNKELRETPTFKRIEIAEPGTQLRAVFCELFMAVGRAQDLKFTIAQNSTFVNAYGFPSDIRITEAIYAHVVGQMIEEAKKFIAKGEWRGETNRVWDDREWRYVEKKVNARVVKRQFYEGFTARIGQRLSEAKREVEKELADAKHNLGPGDDGSVSTEVVLVRKRDEVNDFYSSKTGHIRGSWKGNTNTYTSAAGLRGGREAGNRARLGGQGALPGTRKGLPG